MGSGWKGERADCAVVGRLQSCAAAGHGVRVRQLVRLQGHGRGQASHVRRTYQQEVGDARRRLVRPCRHADRR